MGRAIDMEKDIDSLNKRVKLIEDTIDKIFECVSVKTNIDLVEETKEVVVEEKKSNNETSGRSNGKSNTRKSTSKSKAK